MNPLSLLSGGLTGGISAGGGTSKSGDASSDLNNSFVYGGAFQVGGSGKQSQAADTDGNASAKGGNEILLYVAIGIIGFAAVIGYVSK